VCNGVSAGNPGPVDGGSPSAGGAPNDGGASTGGAAGTGGTAGAGGVDAGPPPPQILEFVSNGRVVYPLDPPILPGSLMNERLPADIAEECLASKLGLPGC